MSKRIFLIYLLLSLFQYSLKAYTLNGYITDNTGAPLPFVSVMVKESHKVCATNEKGYYSFMLDQGEYEIAFSYIGYAQQTQKIIIDNKNVSLNIIMNKTVLMLQEVTINGADEDPAYRIIREAQKKRKYYLEQAKAYSCDVYIKGLQRMKEIPEKIMGFKREDIMRDMIGLDSSGRGIIYLSESVSKFNFMQPDKIKEEMVSSKVSGDNHAFSYNQASDLLFNFYDNTINLSGLSERVFISPISSSAFLYYNYKLEGAFMENGLVVDKIHVLPKRKNDPVFRGYIYIIEDLWNIHSIDLYLTKDAEIDFVDSLGVQQIHSKIENDTWLPTSNKFTFNFGFMGIKGEGYFLGVQSNYILNPDFPKGFFGAEEMKILDDANKKDSSYWESTRPVALTDEENKDYRFKDSLVKITETKVYKDSVDKKRNRFKIGQFILSGYSYTNTFDKYSLNFGLGIFGVNYNLAEGWSLSPSFNYFKYFDNNKTYSLGGSINYGFGNKQIYGTAWANYYFNPVHFSGITFYAGKTTEQFNPGAILPLVNSVYTLFEKRNYIKLYEKQFAALHYRTELCNGIYFNASASFNDRLPLVNTQTWTIKKFQDRQFETNNPQHPDSSGYSFKRNQAIIADIRLSFRIKQRYYTRPNQKVVLGSKYPEFRIEYKKGMDDVNYDLIKAGISKEINFKILGVFKFDVSCGTFSE